MVSAVKLMHKLTILVTLSLACLDDKDLWLPHQLGAVLHQPLQIIHIYRNAV
jgi:hypothetical protein